MDVGGRATQEQLPRMPGIIVIHIQRNGWENLAKIAFPQYDCMDAAVRRPGGTLAWMQVVESSREQRPRVPKVGALGANSRCP